MMPPILAGLNHAAVGTLAMADMRDNVRAAIVVLIFGAFVLGWVQPTTIPARARKWILVVLLLLGPTTAILWVAVEASWLSPESYRQLSDYPQRIFRALSLGVVASAIGTGAFWLGIRARARVWR